MYPYLDVSIQIFFDTFMKNIVACHVNFTEPLTYNEFAQSKYHSYDRYDNATWNTIPII